MNTRPAMTAPIVHRPAVVTATHPISGGIPPHSPPSTMFDRLRLLRAYEYTRTLLNRPNAMNAAASAPCQGLVVRASAAARASEAAASAIPNPRAAPGAILPDGMGLPFVLSITASMSRSW